jgi:hypothetical protein
MPNIDPKPYIQQLKDKFSQTNTEITIKTDGGKDFLDVLQDLYKPILENNKVAQDKRIETVKRISQFLIDISGLDGNNNNLSNQDVFLSCNNELYIDRKNAWLRQFFGGHIVDDNSKPLQLKEPNLINSSMPSINQAAFGNCFHLSAINALCQTAKGISYLKDLITSTNNTYIVRFKPNKKIEVTKDELSTYQKYHLGTVSTDPRISDNLSNQTVSDLILIGYAKVLKIEASANEKQQKDVENKDDSAYLSLPPLLQFVYGGSPENLITNIIGHDKSSLYILDKPTNNTDKRKAEQKLQILASNKGAFAITVAMNGFTQDKNGHGLMLDNIDPENKIVTLRNPWNSDSPITYSYKEFFNNLINLSAISLA